MGEVRASRGAAGTAALGGLIACSEGLSRDPVLLAAILEHVPAAIAVVRFPDLIYELVNPAFQRIAPGKPIAGRTVREVWPEIETELSALFADVARTGLSLHFDNSPFQIRRSPGGPLEEAIFSIDLVPLCTGPGPITRILVLALETTPDVRHMRENETLTEIARRRAAELGGILDNMTDAVFACDEHGRITLANEAARRLARLGPTEPMPATIEEVVTLLAPEDRGGHKIDKEHAPLARALAGETVSAEEEVSIPARAGRLTYLRTTATPLRDARGIINGALSVSRDVTESAELDRMKDQFIRLAAHELRTPVAVLRGCTQALLRTAEELPPPRRRILEGILRGVDRIERIVKALHYVSEIELGRIGLVPEPVDVSALVGRVVADMRNASDTHSVHLSYTDPGVVRGDRERLRQVVTTLIDNAIRYSPRGGDIDVEVRRSDRDVQVSVRDHGVGIPMSQRPQIFQRLYRARVGTNDGGMGLGLFVAKAIIEHHGGRIWFESKEGEGSTFSFALPLAPTPEP
ncbi:PAS domain-containing sensor histidine kinase [Polyangium aurulentum]|uniref:PAS domain-containing sensor histidine kinase n=1 Tax=Polyangium aurulentum TaxID=2567896 RepID=UPI00146B7F4B|nr:ATP-binding protein [Polyangium aurulentum]UQA58770.1 PAS domain-containing protein [Polyangium aurulentum]